MHVNPASSYLETVCLRLEHDDPCLTQLDLGTSMIQNRGASVLKRVLSTNTKLRHLGLFNNHLDADGIMELAEALKADGSSRSACRLEVLYLGNNRIGNRGAAALGEALKYNKSLKKLYLSNGCIGNEGAEALARGLAGNRTLEYLDLLHNPIGAQGVLALKHALEYDNMSLKRLKMDPMWGDVDTNCKSIQAFLRLNRFGRIHALRNSTLPHNAWSLVLSKASSSPDLLYLLVRSKPDLFRETNCAME